MASLLKKPWLLQAALNDTIPKIARAQITEYLKHPDGTTATLYLSDKWHYVETIFTESCIKELSQGVTSLGSLRGGIISVKEGTFQVLQNHHHHHGEHDIKLVVTRAARIGLDGSFTFDNPSRLQDHPAIQELIASKSKDMADYSSANNSACSQLLAIADVFSQDAQMPPLIWEQCIISASQQAKLDCIWAEHDPIDPDQANTADPAGFDSLGQHDHPFSTSSVHFDDEYDFSDSPNTMKIDDFYENVHDIELELDIEFDKNKPRTPPAYLSQIQTQSSQVFHSDTPASQSQEHNFCLPAMPYSQSISSLLPSQLQSSSQHQPPSQHQSSSQHQSPSQHQPPHSPPHSPSQARAHFPPHSPSSSQAYSPSQTHSPLYSTQHPSPKAPKHSSATPSIPPNDNNSPKDEDDSHNGHYEQPRKYSKHSEPSKQSSTSKYSESSDHKSASVVKKIISPLVWIPASMRVQIKPKKKLPQRKLVK